MQFHINSVVRQLWEQDTDIVMVDTGNSYEGLCEYVGGKYISYTEERPITMNPFNIRREELNIEWKTLAAGGAWFTIAGLR